MSAEDVTITPPGPTAVQQHIPVTVEARTASLPVTTTVEECARQLDFLGGPETLFDILFHVLILSFVLQVVFETKLGNLEKHAIHAEVKQALSTTLGATLRGTGPALPPELFDVVGSWFAGDEEHETINRLVVARNRLLIGMMAVACVGFFVVVNSTCRAKNGRLALRNVLVNNAFLLLVVGAIEGVFVFKVILRYAPTQPSMIQRTILERLKSVGDAASRDDSCSDISKPCGPHLPALVRVGGFVVAFAVLAALTRFYEPSTHRFSPSTILWQGVTVSTVISGLFLTLGVTQETLVMESTVHRIVDAYTTSLYKSVRVVSPTVADRLAAKLQSIDTHESTDMEEADRQVDASNAKLQRAAGAIVGTTVVVAIVGTIVERLVVSKGFGLRNEGVSTIVFSALIAACCSFLAEFNFMVNVAAQYRPLSVNDVNESALAIVRAKLAAQESEEEAAVDAED